MQDRAARAAQRRPVLDVRDREAEADRRSPRDRGSGHRVTHEHHDVGHARRRERLRACQSMNGRPSTGTIALGSCVARELAESECRGRRRAPPRGTSLGDDDGGAQVVDPESHLGQARRRPWRHARRSSPRRRRAGTLRRPHPTSLPPAAPAAMPARIHSSTCLWIGVGDRSSFMSHCAVSSSPNRSSVAGLQRFRRLPPERLHRIRGSRRDRRRRRRRSARPRAHRTRPGGCRCRRATGCRGARDGSTARARGRPPPPRRPDGTRTR